MNIFVAKLNFDTQSEDVQRAFEAFGAVDSAKVIMDRETGRSRGFAFVEMAKSAIKRESSNSSNLFQLPASIGGAGGAIKLKPGDLNSDTKTGGSGAGGKKKKGGCC